MILTPEQMAQARTLIAQEKQREAAWLKCIENWKPKHENRSERSDYLADLLAANQGA